MAEFKMKLIKLAMEARYKPSVVFYDRMNEIANKFWEKPFPNWETDRLSFRLIDNDKREVVQFKHDRVIYVKEDIDSTGEIPDEYRSLFVMVNKHYAEMLNIDKVLRLGVRFQATIDYGYKFDELVELLGIHYYPDGVIEKITGKNFKDVGYSSVYEVDGYKVRLQMGPIETQQLIEKTGPVYMKKTDLPSVSLFIDLDGFGSDIEISKVDALTKRIHLRLLQTIPLLSKALIDAKGRAAKGS